MNNVADEIKYFLLVIFAIVYLLLVIYFYTLYVNMNNVADHPKYKTNHMRRKENMKECGFFLSLQFADF